MANTKQTAFAKSAWAVLETMGKAQGFSILGLEFEEVEAAEPLEASKDVVKSLDVKILKTQEEEERYVLGIVLEPTLEMNAPDSQGDVYSAEEVRLAALSFMEDYQIMGVQHKEEAAGRIKILESWIQRDDAVIEGQTVVKGTWMLGARIVDDDLWLAVKEGRITGWSIGGVAQRTPLNLASS